VKFKVIGLRALDWYIEHGRFDRVVEDAEFRTSLGMRCATRSSVAWLWQESI
jgi:hypothetical protein